MQNQLLSVVASSKDSSLGHKLWDFITHLWGDTGEYLGLRFTSFSYRDNNNKMVPNWFWGFYEVLGLHLAKSQRAVSVTYLLQLTPFWFLSFHLVPLHPASFFSLLSSPLTFFCCVLRICMYIPESTEDYRSPVLFILPSNTNPISWKLS